MAEGQGDIEAITLMKTNEGYSWRGEKERKEGRDRDKKKRVVMCVCVCVCVWRDSLPCLRLIKHNTVL